MTPVPGCWSRRQYQGGGGENTSEFRSPRLHREPPLLGAQPLTSDVNLLFRFSDSSRSQSISVSGDFPVGRSRLAPCGSGEELILLSGFPHTQGKPWRRTEWAGGAGRENSRSGRCCVTLGCH